MTSGRADRQPPQFPLPPSPNKEDKPEERRLFSFVSALIMTVVSVLALLGGLAWYGIVSYRDTLAKAEEQSQTYRDAFAAHTLRTLDATKLVIDQLSFTLGHASTEEGWRERAQAEPFLAQMRDYLDTVPQLKAVWVVDLNGNMVSCVGPLLAPSHQPPMPLALDKHRRATEVVFDIGHPLQTSPCLGDTVVVPATKTILDGFGKPVGVVAGAVDPAYFSTFFAALKQGAHSTMGLIHVDGILLSREPYSPSKIGADATKSEIYQAFQSGQTIGAKRAVSPVDGEERIGAFVKLEGLPVIAYVATAVKDAMIPWRNGLREWLPFSGLVLVLLVATGGATVISAWQSERMARTLRARSQALSQTKTELEQIAYVVSHDLREPLRQVSSYVQLLRKRYQSSLDSQADEYIDFAVDGVKVMHTRLGDLISYLDVEMDREPEQVVDLRVVANDAVAALGPKINATRAAITLSGQAAKVVGKRSQIRLLFFQILDNALTHRIADRDPQVIIGIERGDGGWMVSVRDNGPGIAPTYRDQVFKVFRRLVATADPRHSGSGIGLALCQRIVTGHGGKIWIDGAPEGGCDVRFTLPAEG